MKKLSIILVAVIALAGCKKEKLDQVIVSQPASMSDQVAALIKRGDPAMYDRIYGQNKTGKPSIHTHPGVFHIPNGDPASGFCVQWPNCVCYVCLDFPKLVTDWTPEDEITRDYHRTWTEPGDGELIINDAAGTTIQDLKSLDDVFDSNQNSTFTYTTL